MKINSRAEKLSELLRNELIRRRTESGLSKNQTAAKAALAVSFVSNLESGQRRPTVETLAKLAWTFGTNPSELLACCEKLLAKESEEQ